MNKDFLNKIHKAHFVGIGGIGISALARLMVAQGKKVTANDIDTFPVHEGLQDIGVEIKIGKALSDVDLGADVIIYSIAWDNIAPELINAVRAKGVLLMTYPEALGMISRGMRTVAVSGTHGKTTTTAMIAGVLVGARVDPTVIVGSLLKSGTNFIAGKSDIFVVEACEYKRSFINLSPEILVITNIDNDHLDYYGSIEGVQKAFAEMVEKVPAHGAIVCNPNDPLVAPVLANAVAKIVDYSLGNETSKLELQVSGDHNIKNAKAALAVARILGVDEKEACALLAEFQGTWRRMEFKGEMESGALVYDDYAHHPTEIKATLQGFRAKYPEGNIRVIFQPHLYSRTKLLLNDFAQSFGDADEVIFAPIYAARENPDPSISIDVLVWQTAKHHKCPRIGGDFSAIEKYIRETSTPNDIIITMGAGDVFKVGEALLGKL